MQSHWAELQKKCLTIETFLGHAGLELHAGRALAVPGK